MGLVRRTLIAAFVLAFASACASAPQVAWAQARSASAAPQRDPLDINTATRDQLKTLPGIGDAYADRILKGRPYAAKNQLTQKGIIPGNTYSGIQALIVAKRPK